MKKNLIIFNAFILLLSGCVSLQKKPLTFIHPQLGFNIQESQQADKLKRKFSLVYQGKESFTICKDYKNINLTYKYHNELIKQYYLTNINKDIAEYVLLEYFNKNLIRVEIISKGNEKINVLLKKTEEHFGRKIEWSEPNDLGTRKIGQIFKKNWLDALIFYYPKDEEITISVLTTAVGNPHVCGNAIKGFRRKYR